MNLLGLHIFDINENREDNFNKTLKLNKSNIFWFGQNHKKAIQFSSVEH